MKKIMALLLTLIFCLSILAGCGSSGGSQQSSGNQSNTESKEETNTATPPAPGSLTAASNNIMVCIASDPETIDPARNSSVDGATMLQNAFSGLYAWDVDSNGKQIIVADCAEAVVQPTEIADGKYEYVITLKPDLKWSDGEALHASDFVYSWNRAVDPATLADYQYIFDVIDGYDGDSPDLNISADDNARTITIVTSAFCAYFDQLLAFPTYFPVRRDIVEANPDAWATKVDSYVSNGAFTMTEWVVGSYIRFEPNPY